MPGDEKRTPEPPRRDQAAPNTRKDGAVPLTTEENEKAAEGERVEKSPNPGHPV